MGTQQANTMRVTFLTLAALLLLACTVHAGRGKAMADPKLKEVVEKAKAKAQEHLSKTSLAEIGSGEWIEAKEVATANHANTFEALAGRNEHFELAEDDEWASLMSEWKSDLKKLNVPQEHLVEWGFSSLFGKSKPSTKTISMDMDASAAGGMASGSLCVQAAVPSMLPTKMLGQGMKKVFDSVVLKKLAEKGLTLEPDKDTELVAQGPCDQVENNKQLFSFGTPNIPFIGKLSLSVFGAQTQAALTPSRTWLRASAGNFALEALTKSKSTIDSLILEESLMYNHVY